jgi:scyllo-inositol 2-dehydrogenase (NADP+)
VRARAGLAGSGDPLQTVRTAIVGYGYAGRVMHAQLVKAARGLELVAVATRDGARRAQAVADHGCATYETVAELLAAKAADLVVVATPHDTHRDLAVQCLEAGCHVVTDKLMCMNAAEADQMIAAAARAGRMLSVFHNRRWDCGLPVRTSAAASTARRR